MPADNEGTEARLRQARATFVTERDMLQIIASDRYTVPMTLSTRNYSFYSGQRAATVLTLRFNVTSASFSQLFVTRHVMNVLNDNFSHRSMLTGCVDYDFVLCKSNSVPKSYYIWQANSNRAQYNEVNETTMSFTHANVNRFCRDAVQVHLPDLEINFISSDFVIDRLLSITISFIF